MSHRLEHLILNGLIAQEDYSRKVLPFIKEEYFSGSGEEKTLFTIIKSYIGKYNNLPSIAALNVEIDSLININAQMYQRLKELTILIEKAILQNKDLDWLTIQTEKFCQDQALYGAIMEAIQIMESDKNKTSHSSLTKTAIPQILTQALTVGFDTKIGHDFLNQAQDRIDHYKKKEMKIPFDIDLFNTITGGGLANKTLNIIMASCVHPETIVYTKLVKNDTLVDRVHLPIIEIDRLLKDGYRVDVYSPDGWVMVKSFVDKGFWTEYVVETENGKKLRCSANHFLKTEDNKWTSVQFLYESNEKKRIQTTNGLSLATVTKSTSTIPIVDIEVDHEEHCYYTNEIESHNTGVGKSLCMCHMAANNLLDSKNVLYITLEMSEEEIAKRIDANILDKDINSLMLMNDADYKKGIDVIRSKVAGRLIIKEYPTASASVSHFRHLLDELKLRENFKPDIIYIDYLNICLSSRMKMGNSVNSYTYIKAIAEELRGLAVEFDCPLVSATQSNRASATNSDVEIDGVSESFGIPMSADLFFAIISNDQLADLNQFMIKQLKNRYNNPNLWNKFYIGVDKSKMRLFNLDKSAQQQPAAATTEPPQAKSKFKGFKM